MVCLAACVALCILMKRREKASTKREEDWRRCPGCSSHLVVCVCVLVFRLFVFHIAGFKERGGKAGGEGDEHRFYIFSLACNGYEEH